MIIVIPVAIGFVGVAVGVCFPVHPKQCRIIVHPLATPPPLKKPLLALETATSDACCLLC